MLISDYKGNTEDIKSLAIPIFGKKCFWNDFEYGDRTFIGTIERNLIYHPFFTRDLGEYSRTPLLRTVIEQEFEKVILFYHNNIPKSIVENTKQLVEVSFFVKEITFQNYDNPMSFVEPAIINFEFVNLKEIKVH